MTFSFEFEFGPAIELIQRLKAALSAGAGIRSGDLSEPIGKRIAQVLREDVRRQFAEGGIPAWAPLAPSTIREKERAGYPRLNRSGKLSPDSLLLQRGSLSPANILIRTGALVESWTKPGPNHVEIITDSSVEIGSSLPYAKYPQEGKGRQPQRPVTVTDRALKQVEEIIKEKA